MIRMHLLSKYFGMSSASKAEVAAATSDGFNKTQFPAAIAPT
jgi:hypothetical protein